MSKSTGMVIGSVVGIAVALLAAWAIHATGLYQSIQTSLDTGILATLLLVVCIGLGILLGALAGQEES